MLRKSILEIGPVKELWERFLKINSDTITGEKELSSFLKTLEDNCKTCFHSNP
jgi:hypothetical protein